MKTMLSSLIMSVLQLETTTLCFASSATPLDGFVSEQSLIKPLITRPLLQLTNPGNWQSG